MIRAEKLIPDCNIGVPLIGTASVRFAPWWYLSALHVQRLTAAKSVFFVIKNNCLVLAAATRDSPLPGRKLTRLSKPGSPSGASTGSNTSSSGSNKKVGSHYARNVLSSCFVFDECCSRF